MSPLPALPRPARILAAASTRPRPTRRRLAALTLAAALTPVALVAPVAPPAAAGGHETGSGRLGDYRAMSHSASPTYRVRAVAAHPRGCHLVGDSIANGARAQLFARLARERGARCTYDVWSGRPTAAAANSFARTARASAGRLPGRLVVVSGANDIFAPAAFPAAAQRIVRTAAGRPVVWVDTYVARPGRARADLRNSARVNASLHALDRRHGNVEVVRWNAFLRGKPSRPRMYLADGVHPNAAGRAALAALVSRAWR